MTTTAIETKHRLIAASKLQRTILCPGSVWKTKDLAQTSSVAAEHGTLLHEVMSRLLKSNSPDHDQHCASLPPADKQLVMEALNYVKQQNNYPNVKMLLDYEVVIPDMNDEVGGTADVVQYSSELLAVTDFKFGFTPVTASHNRQLLCYLLGCVHQLYGGDPPPKMVVKIVQPVIDNYDEWWITPFELNQFKDLLDATYNLVISPNPPLAAGEEQCKWCEAKGNCPSYIEMTFGHMVELYKPNTLGPETSSEKLAQLLNLEAPVNRAFDAIRQELFNRLLRGQHVPGYKLAKGRRRREWLPDVDAIAIEDLTGLDGSYLIESKLASPAKVEKMLPKADRKKLEDLYTYTEGDMIMAADSSTKPKALVFEDYADTEPVRLF